MWYISYFYGMIYPVCAESAVKHQLSNLCMHPCVSVSVSTYMTRGFLAQFFHVPIFANSVIVSAY